jgi:hypothetical protein
MALSFKNSWWWQYEIWRGWWVQKFYFSGNNVPWENTHFTICIKTYFMIKTFWDGVITILGKIGPQQQVQGNQQLSLSMTCNKSHILYVSTDGISVMSQASMYWTVLHMTLWTLICFCNNTITGLSTPQTKKIKWKYSLAFTSEVLYLLGKPSTLNGRLCYVSQSI